MAAEELEPAAELLATVPELELEVAVESPEEPAHPPHKTAKAIKIERDTVMKPPLDVGHPTNRRRKCQGDDGGRGKGWFANVLRPSAPAETRQTGFNPCVPHTRLRKRSAP